MVRIWRYLRKIWMPFHHCAAPQRSAAVCFYLFLSIPSFLSLFFRLYAQFPFLSESLQQPLKSIIPDVFWTMAGIYFQTLSSPEALSLSLATILWSISRAITALADGLNAAIDVPIEDTFFQKRLRALLQFLLLSVSVLGMLSFVVYGQQLLSYFQSSKSIHLVSAHIFSILYLTTCFTVMYRILLCKKHPARYCILGAMSAALGWYGFSCLYSTYIAFLDNQADPFGAILTFMIWIHICFTVLFYGCVLTKLASEKEFRVTNIISGIFQTRKPK